MRKRNAGKRYKLPGLSQLVQNLKFWGGWSQNLKFFRPKSIRRTEQIDATQMYDKLGWPPGIGVARIFDWGGPKPQITRNDVIRNFQKSNFLWGKDIVEWKI